MLEGVILAGGRGERFWPLSRRARPKQLLNLFGEASLLGATWERLRLRLAPDGIRVIAGADLEAVVRAELSELDAATFVCEPVGRNTAPACAVAAALALRGGHDPLQLVVPADHWIPDNPAFWRTVDAASAVAGAPDGPLVTFGIPITRPEIAYGYIERGEPRVETERAFRVKRFHEKPDPASARVYAGNTAFYWNSGIFLWRASSLRREIARHLPELAAAVAPLSEHPACEPELRGVFETAPSISIDHGVLERSDAVAVVEAGFAWNDLGSWSSWAEQMTPDGAGNVSRGAVVSVDTQDCVTYCDSGLIATLGVKDLVVVRAGDVTLVVERSRCQEVRRLIEALRADPDLKGYL
jgi:mannose-1-phosphate guanylyltransferase/mannose-6-phosphate isomerase